MAEAYATFAAGGIHCNPIIVSKIVNRKGKQLEAPNGDCKRVMDKDVADGVNKVLKAVINKGTGTRALVRDGRDQAGKTGTIDSAEAVWFAGYTPKIAGVAMISIDNQKKPFMKGKAGFRSHGVTGYRVPSTGQLPRGLRLGRLGPVHLEARHAAVLQAGPAHQVRRARRRGSRPARRSPSPTSAT